MLSPSFFSVIVMTMVVAPGVLLTCIFPFPVFPPNTRWYRWTAVTGSCTAPTSASPSFSGLRCCIRIFHYLIVVRSPTRNGSLSSQTTLGTIVVKIRCQEVPENRCEKMFQNDHRHPSTRFFITMDVLSCSFCEYCLSAFFSVDCCWGLPGLSQSRPRFLVVSSYDRRYRHALLKGHLLGVAISRAHFGVGNSCSRQASKRLHVQIVTIDDKYTCVDAL